MSDSGSTRLPISELRQYYEALVGLLKEQEQTALAEVHADNPTHLANRFRRSIEGLAQHPKINEPFYDSERADPADPDNRATSIGDIKSTLQFAAELCDGRSRRVTGGELLAFRYVDREISPLRSKHTRREDRVARRSLDLLLANARDNTPIFAELKLRGDRPTYFALVQLLMLVAEFLPARQRERGAKFQPPAGNLAWPAAGPFADAYIVAFEPPTTGKYRQRSFDATARICEKLIARPDVSSIIRRIAYIEATDNGAGGLAFTSKFAFGRGL